jgi:protein PhnA
VGLEKTTVNQFGAAVSPPKVTTDDNSVDFVPLHLHFPQNFMALTPELEARAAGACELCTSSEPLQYVNLEALEGTTEEISVAVCETCAKQLLRKDPLDSAHWQILSTTMWSEHRPVKIAAWRMLQRLKDHTWAADALEMLYLDDDEIALAKLSGDLTRSAEVEFHQDANGNRLEHGDTVVLIKSLDVKGSSLTAKMGTVVRNIRLDANNPNYIEGRVEGQQIVILTQYVRKG